jgi:hypothetical protein
VSISPRAFPLPHGHRDDHRLTHARWLDVIAWKQDVQIGRGFVQACCVETVAALVSAMTRTAIVVVGGASQVNGRQTFSADMGGERVTLSMRELSSAPNKRLRNVWTKAIDGARRPFQISASSRDAQVTGKIVRGPATTMDPRVTELLIDTVKATYGALAAGRTVPLQPDELLHALQQMVLALLALSASELEAIATLLQYDQMPTTRIHVRALGEHALHAVLFMEDMDLAKRAYQATNASHLDLLERFDIDAGVRERIAAQIDASVESKTLKQIMAKAPEAKTAVGALQAWESTALSKWAHGDAVALKEVAARLRRAGTDLGAAINRTTEGNGSALRAVYFALILLYATHACVGVDAAPFHDLRTRHAELAREFHDSVPPELRSRP